MIQSLTQWLQQHDTNIDIITLWALAIGFGLFGLVKLVSWWTLRQQHDQTMVGVSLKWQKLGEMILGFGLATLYAMTLSLYYQQGTSFGFWERLILRIGLFFALTLVSFHGVQFVIYLRKEARRPTQGAIPLARKED